MQLSAAEADAAPDPGR